MAKLDIHVTRHLVDGFTLSTIHKGERVWFRYIGYTMREAKKDFRQYIRGLGK